MLLLAVCLVYSNSLANGFHFDDFHTVTDNPAVRSVRNLRRIFTDTTAFSVLPANQTYRPVVTASLALDYALGHGYAPLFFHLSTMFWFLALVVLLFLLSEDLFNRVEPSPANSWLALGVAAWFGLHPAMAETVNYVIQRGDLYCTLGCVAALFAYARWPRLRRYGLYLFPFALAMLSKPPAAVFPLLLLLFCFFFEQEEQPLAARWWRSSVSAAPALVVTALLLWLQSAMTPKSFLPSILSPADYRLTQGYVWMRYAVALFLPLHLNVDTDLQPFSSVNPQALTGIVFVLGLVVAIVYTGRRRRLRPITFGLLWFVLTQLPTSLYPLSEVENDHRMFFSFPGLMLAVVWTLHVLYRSILAGDSARRRWLRPILSTAAVLALCGYAWGAHRRNAVWFSEDTLWADDAAKSPHNGRGLMIYGLTRMNAGDLAGALQLYTQALAYTPNYPTLEINLGIVNGLMAAQGHPELNALAERHFERAVTLAPGDDTTHAYYGRWLLAQGRLAEARAQLQTAISLNAQRPMQRDLLLNVYRQTGNSTAAHSLAEQALALDPEDASALAVLHGAAATPAQNAVGDLMNASLAAYREGRFQQSIEEAQRALALDPHLAEAWNNIGAGYGGLRRWPAAVAAEEQALRLNPGLQIAQNNLRWFQGQSLNKGASDDGVSPVPPSVAGYVDLSQTLHGQGRYEESIAAAKKALLIDDRSAEAWNNIAADEEGLHRWDEAIAAARRAIALRPDFQLAKNNLAWAQQQRAKEQR